MHSLPTLIELMRSLVSSPSVSCSDASIDQSNRDVIDTLAGWFETIGFATETQTLADGKANLIATLGTGENGLILAGHTDTVPFDADRWQSDPFVLTERDDRFYGLGTTDMKCFFALIIEALRDIDLDALTRPLIILATADEETSMAGAKALTADHVRGARYAVIGEPTSLRPVRMHKGMMMDSIRLTGLAGHSSDPSLGRNALDAMHAVITDLMSWRENLKHRYNNPLFSVPHPTLNFGHIHGGDNPNRICSHCELQIDLRPLPGMSIDNLRHEMSQRLETTLRDTGIELEIATIFDGVEATETPETSDIVETIQRLTGQDAEAVAFGTEAPYLNELGVETIIYGPGDIGVAHQPDEYIAQAAIQPCVNTLKQLIHRYCIE